jgi:hypothetical protein
MLLSAVLVALTAAITGNHPAWQTFGFAIFGAMLQTAFLGFVYEVYLRDQVENSTLSRLNLARDVADNGLVRISSSSSLDWTRVLTDTSTLCIVSGEPQRVLGLASGAALDRASRGHLRRLRIAIPEARWDSVSSWLTELEALWSAQAPDAEFLSTRLVPGLAFDFVANDTSVFVLLPATVNTPNGSEAKLLEFARKSKPDSVGAWLDAQVLSVLALTPSRGHGVAAELPQPQQITMVDQVPEPPEALS